VAFKTPDVAAARQAAVELMAESLDDSNFDVLPVVPRGWLHDAFARHTPEDHDLVLRHKIVPISWIPTMVLYAVVNDVALREARQQGLRVVARIETGDYRAAIKRQRGRMLLMHAVRHLHRSQPHLSARQRLTTGQALAFLGVASAAVAFAATVGGSLFFTSASLAGTLFFVLVIGIRLFCLLPSPHPPRTAAARLAEEELPVYSVLVPLFRETAIVPQLIRSLLGLDYPPDRLDIKLILEESDPSMHRVVAALDLPSHFEVIVVPSGKPQTKPRALNYGLQLARGTLVTIYDAEDIPAPGQLKLAASAFQSAPESLACLQASLAFYNPGENWLTRQFAAEYAALFRVMLPALAERGLPILLGGTSNHFRREALLAVGAWDPFNVTEDADLGLRLARGGYGCGVLASVTLEEANMELFNWLMQRRRWLKGFLQTWLVHMRAPVQLARELGFEGFWTAQCLTLGVVGSALFHPFLLVYGLWSLLPENMSKMPATTTAHALAGLSLAVLVGGYVVSMSLAALGLRRIGMGRRLGVVATLPIYWLLISLAAWQALWDFLVRPFHWHKTRHGISRTSA
jgi:cellulose synthase/poly-beta-1,6-N-acetylglucosamine synthase-like glycosyltransferase